MLSTQAIQEFKKIYKDKFGVVLTVSESEKYGMQLISLVRAVYGNRLPELKTIDNTKRQAQT